jgi:hypothetical protein
VEEGPIPAVHGVVRWRACDLIVRLHEEFGISVSDDTVYRALKVPSGMRLEFGGGISGNMRLSFQAARSIG